MNNCGVAEAKKLKQASLGTKEGLVDGRLQAWIGHACRGCIWLDHDVMIDSFGNVVAFCPLPHCVKGAS